eukprot:15461664-Alexandrium_andersonii.AAC.1
MERVKVVGDFSGCVGEPRWRPTSIPQGCPLSMAVLGFLAAPWIRCMEAKGLAAPRALADDMLLATEDSEPGMSEIEHFERHAEAIQDTIDFVTL